MPEINLRRTHSSDQHEAEVLAGVLEDGDRHDRIACSRGDAQN